MISRQRERSAQLQVCQCADGIRADDPAMIENLLKLGDRFRIPVRGQQRLAAHIGRVQTAKIKVSEVEAVHRQLIGQSDLQPLHAVGGLPVLQCRQRAKNRYVSKFGERIFREALFQIIGKRLRSRGVSRKSQGKAGGVFDIPAIRKRQRRHGVLFRFGSIPAHGFPHRSCGLVTRGRLASPLLPGQIDGAAG